MRVLPRHWRVLALLVAAALVLVTLDLRGGGASALRSAAAAAAGPAERALAAVSAPVGTVADAGAWRRRAEEAERRAARLAAELWAERAAHDRDAGRRRLQAAHPSLTLVPAQVVATGGDSVTIDAGTGDGVRPGLAVVTADGLVGRVAEAGPDVATVLLATAPPAAAGVRLAGSRAIGTVEGRRDGRLGLRLFDADARLSPGQRVETLGSSGSRPYPPGLPVGTVERVEPARDQLTRTALVRPAVTFGTLDVVGVITDAG
ncbi:rod shape-determining protein MreC [Nonomuraea sp. NPDC050783]|uniref:rod shape-determining protein MreC n=1 Tax=Nonomuraea sp. NPDC050783 TaxID=3154634 RepID=UPI0034650C3A